MFNKNTTLIVNACYAANQPFATAVYNSRVRNYAAGITALSDADALATAIDVLTTLLLNNNTSLNVAFTQASLNVEDLLNKDTADTSPFNIGVWGYFSKNQDSDANAYYAQLFNNNKINSHE